MISLAIDPGTRQSAILAYDSLSRSRPLRIGLWPPQVAANEVLLASLRVGHPSNGLLLIESVESYGQRVGAEVFETVRWSGRFQEAWEAHGGLVRVVPRRTVKAHLCGVQKAKDADIRQALLYRFGDGTRETAVGVKARPGPLYGIGSHLWAALAVAVTWCDQNAGESVGTLCHTG